METQSTSTPMEIETILAAFSENAALPVDAIRAAAARREEIAPRFVEIVERCASSAEDISHVTSPLFIVFHMLGQFRWKPAYRPLARLLRIDGGRLEAFLGDAITETSHRVMAAVFDGDLEPVHAIIEDEAANEYVRGHMFVLLGMLAKSGELPRDEVARYLRDSYMNLRHEHGNHVWVGWQSAISMLGLTELKSLVKRIFKTGIVPPSYMSHEDFLEDLGQGSSGRAGPLGEWERMTPFDDVIDELSSWAFADPAASRVIERDYDRHYEYLSDYFGPKTDPARGAPGAFVVPATNPNRHVGRNDPCPCGSGKKFKRCCLQ